MIQIKLDNKYRDFFKKFKITNKTGCLKDYPKIKFPTYPYIGSKYGKSIKILIVGLDIGSDETQGRTQSFEERRKAIEDKDKSKHNPHIAGTYFTALFFLKHKLNLQNCWEKLNNELTFQKALKKNKELPVINPLSYIALTNYYKFVSVNRKNKTGGENRRFIDKQLKIIELDFFIDEVKVFNPDIIIFQSKSFWNKKRLLNKLSKIVKLIYIGPHPSWRGKEKRRPNYFVKQILLYKKEHAI